MCLYDANLYTCIYTTALIFCKRKKNSPGRRISLTQQEMSAVQKNQRLQVGQ